MDYDTAAQQTKAPRKKNSVMGKLIIAVLIVIALIVLATTCIRTVPTGYTGILTTFGRVEDANLDAGFHLKAPWQNIVLMDNRVQKSTVSTQAFSSDIQQVDLTLTATYSINKAAAADLYKKVGTRYYDSIIYPQLLENSKAVFANYTAEALIEQRDQLAMQIAEKMRGDLDAYGIDVSAIAIEDIDFSDRFTDAIEAKQVATQELQRAQTEQEQATMEAQAAAERQRIAAEAEAEVAKIAADAEAYAITAKAEAEAEANVKLAESITKELIEYNQAQNWNGELPSTYVGSSDALPILNVEDANEKAD